MLAIAFGVPLLLVAVERGIRVVHARAAMLFQGLLVGALSAAAVMPWLRKVQALAVSWEVAIGATFLFQRTVRIAIALLEAGLPPGFEVEDAEPEPLHGGLRVAGS